MLSALGLLAAFLGCANAHTIFQRVYVNGVDQGYLNGVRYPTVSIFMTFTHDAMGAWIAS